MPFSIPFILLLTYRQPRTGAEIMRAMTPLRSQRQYFSGTAIFVSYFRESYDSFKTNYTLKRTFLGPLNNVHRLSLVDGDFPVKCQRLRIQFYLFTFLIMAQSSFYLKPSQYKPESSTVSKNKDALIKRPQSPLLETTKKIHFDLQEKRNTETSINSRPTISQQSNESIEDSKSGLRNQQGTLVTSIIGSFLKKEKQLPAKTQAVSPRITPTGSSPCAPRNSQAKAYFPGARSTLKGLLQKGSMDKSNFHQKSPTQKQKIQSQHMSYNQIQQQPKPQQGKSKTLRIIQKENEILKEQNQLLKKELSEIKNQLMFGTPNKKQQLISNLRDTIKKQDATIRELKLKLDIANKKVSTLNSMLQTKDEQIKMLSCKVDSLQLELIEMKNKSGQKYDSIKEKINFLMRSYSEVEKKFSQNELEWLKVKQQWLQEKSVYLHRIQFLEGYISNNH